MRAGLPLGIKGAGGQLSKITRQPMAIDQVHASPRSDYYLLPDREVVVEVISVPELV